MINQKSLFAFEDGEKLSSSAGKKINFQDKIFEMRIDSRA